MVQATPSDPVTEASTHLTYLLGKLLRIHAVVPECGHSPGEKSLSPHLPTMSTYAGCGGQAAGLCYPGWWVAVGAKACHVLSERLWGSPSRRVSSGSCGQAPAQGEAWYWASLSLPDSLDNTPFCPRPTHCEPPEAGSQPWGQDVRHSGGTSFHLSSFCITSSQGRCCCPL